MKKKNVMTRIMAITVATCLGLAAFPKSPVKVARAGGLVGGMADVYIYTVEDLVKLGEDIKNKKNTSKGKKYKLVNDLDLTEYCAKNNGWNPIGTDFGDHAFMGEFSGAFHTIKGLHIAKVQR